MIDRFREFILGLSSYNKDIKIAVSYSGGSDSGVLLYLFVKLFDEKLIAKPSIIYFNHNLRGQESVKEKDFVYNTAQNYGVELIEYDLDVSAYAKKMNLTIETAARELRYEHYQKVEGRFDYIAQGHHADDNTETVLYNILRGSGMEGASGIKQVREKIIRPLLNFSRNELSTYAGQNKIGYIEDSSNAETNYTRNKIRNLIIPFIEKELDRNVKSSVLRFSGIVSEANEYISGETNRKLHKQTRFYENICIMNKTEFMKGHTVIQKGIVSFIFKRLGSVYSINSFHLNSILDKIVHEELTVFKMKDISVSSHQNNIIFVNKDFTLNTKISIKNKAVSDLYFDSSKIKGKLQIQVISPEDFFIPFGKTRREKISKVLSDKKIPAVFRDRLICLKDDEKLVYIHGAGISNSVKTDKDTTDIKYIKITNDLLRKLF